MSNFVIIESTDKADAPATWLDCFLEQIPVTPTSDEKTYGFTDPFCFDRGITRERCLSPTGDVHMGFTVLSKKVPAGKLKSAVARRIYEEENAQGGKISRNRKAEIKKEMKEAFLTDAPVDCKINSIYRRDDTVYLYATSDSLISACLQYMHDLTQTRWRRVTFGDSILAQITNDVEGQEAAIDLASKLKVTLGSAFLLYLLHRAYEGSTTVNLGSPLTFVVQGDVTLENQGDDNGAALVGFHKGTPTIGKDFRMSLKTKTPTNLGLIFDYEGAEYALQLSSDLVVSGFNRKSANHKHSEDPIEDTAANLAVALEVIVALYTQFCRDSRIDGHALRKRIKAMREGDAAGV